MLQILYALEAALAAARGAILAAHPDVGREGAPGNRLVKLDGAGWIADEILTHLTGLGSAITRYAVEVERTRGRAVRGALPRPGTPPPPRTGKWAA